MLMQSRAVLRYTRISPRKAQLVAGLIRSQSAERALGILKFSPKRAARIMEEVLRSAIANAAQNPEVGSVDNLYVSEVYVDAGPTLKRFRPCSMGRAHRIRKRTSHITVVLEEAISERGGK